MTIEYPLSLAEARAALVNEPPRTEVQSSKGLRWRRFSEGWDIQNQKAPDYRWGITELGPTQDGVTYRIIPVGHPDHSEYVAKPAYNLLTLKECFYEYPYVYVIHPDESIPLRVDSHCRVYFADVMFNAIENGWPIVATREEAEAVLKERG